MGTSSGMAINSSKWRNVFWVHLPSIVRLQALFSSKDSLQKQLTTPWDPPVESLASIFGTGMDLRMACFLDKGWDPHSIQALIWGWHASSIKAGIHIRYRATIGSATSIHLCPFGRARIGAATSIHLCPFGRTWIGAATRIHLCPFGSARIGAATSIRLCPFGRSRIGVATSIHLCPFGRVRIGTATSIYLRLTHLYSQKSYAVCTLPTVSRLSPYPKNQYPSLYQNAPAPRAPTCECHSSKKLPLKHTRIQHQDLLKFTYCIPASFH
jgi:hypothetical protein